MKPTLVHHLHVQQGHTQIKINLLFICDQCSVAKNQWKTRTFLCLAYLNKLLVRVVVYPAFLFTTIEMSSQPTSAQKKGVMNCKL